jgi:hypothetical protein
MDANELLAEFRQVYVGAVIQGIVPDADGKRWRLITDKGEIGLDTLEDARELLASQQERGRP